MYSRCKNRSGYIVMIPIPMVIEGDFTTLSLAFFICQCFHPLHISWKSLMTRVSGHQSLFLFVQLWNPYLVIPLGCACGALGTLRDLNLGFDRGTSSMYIYFVFVNMTFFWGMVQAFLPPWYKNPQMVTRAVRLQGD